MTKSERRSLDRRIVGYKVTTNSLESLGLRKNPNIIKYPVGEWLFIPKEEIVSGSGDYGGIWVCKNISGAKKLKKYMEDNYEKETRIFKSYLAEILYQNSYRIKTNGILMIEEI